jgi:PAS domain S-box-containing protein
MPRTGQNMAGNVATPPFGLSPAQPAFNRATLVAKILFGALDSAIVLIDQGRVWRSRDPLGDLPTADPASEHVMTSGELLWIADGLEDPAFAGNPLVAGGMRLRFYAGAPVRLGDGTTPGVLCVVDDKPRHFDRKLAQALQNLADSVADECDRARAAVAAAAAEAELEETRAALTAFVQSVPVSMMMMDREMRLLQVSPKWLEGFGLSAEQVIGQIVYDISPKYFRRFRADFERCLAGETIKGDRVDGGRGGDGRKLWLQTELVPWRGADGQTGGIIVLAHNITEMVEAIDSMERSEQRLTMAIDMADMHVWEVDYERRELFRSAAESRFFDRNYTFDELAPDTTILIDEQDRERVAQERRAARREGRSYIPEFRLTRSDGRELWVASTVQMIRNDKDDPQRLVGVMQNITDRKTAEAELIKAKEDAEAANRAKSTFLATMSHEIRTPLNGVLGMAQAMVVDALSDVQRERLDVIRQSGETLLAILNDVLDLSKIEAGKLELEETEFDIVALARGAHAAFTAIANKKGLSFGLTVRPAAKGVWVGDSTRVRQILYNLVSNALKFTETGEVRVEVETGGEGLRLIVSDTGIGITPDALQGLFQKFEQADASTTRRYGGTGLGLAICRELAGLMGGSISVHSELGAGSVFTVDLPLAKVADGMQQGDGEPAAQGSDAKAPPAGALGGSALRVLAAEDNSVNQLVIKTLLHQIGIEPHIVSTGREAVDAWEGDDWDLILMDIQMPEMDGPTASGIIRERERARGRTRTPIVALTANAMSHQVAQYLEAGMDDFIAKPIEVSRLFSVLQRVLAEEELATDAA